MGVCVYALAPDYDDDLRLKVVDLGAQPVDFSLSRTGVNAVRDALDTVRLAFLLRRLRPDVTLSYFIKPVIFGTLAAWMAGVPHRVAMIEGLGYVFTSNGQLETLQRKFLRGLVIQLYRMALAHAHKIIFLNQDDIDEFLEAGLLQQCKVVKLGGIGVNLADWPCSQL